VFQSHSFPLPSPLFFLPYLFLSPLPPRSRTSSTNKAATTLHSYAPLLHLNLGSLFHTNGFLPISLCAQSEDVYPCSLYTDIRATATVRTTRVYICPPARRGGQRFNKKFVSFFSISLVCSRHSSSWNYCPHPTLPASHPPSQADSASSSPFLLLSPLFMTTSPLSRSCSYLQHHLSQTSD
jgi:hypothetical protein